LPISLNPGSNESKLNHREAAQLRYFATQSSDESIIKFMGDAPLVEILRLNLILVADLLDIYEDNGVELSEWTAAKKLVEYVVDGPVHPRGSSVFAVT
jgi:hypothetical protein